MFISFEGIDGSGKSTQVKLLSQRLGQYPHLITREPGGCPLGGKIRHLLLHGGNSGAPLCNSSELFLMLADRAQHVSEIIRPALAEGITVITDRYIDSTLAYQGYARGFPIEKLIELNSLATGGLEPDLTVLVDITPEISADRISRTHDRIEADTARLRQLLYDGYRRIAAANSHRYLTVDGNRPPEAVHEEIYTAVKAALGDTDV